MLGVRGMGKGNTGQIKYSVHPDFCWGVDTVNDRISSFRGDCWERGGDFFQRVAVFT